MNYEGIDTASCVSLDAAKKLYAMGYRFVGRYLAPNTELYRWKLLTESEATNIRSAGLAILPIWETSSSRARGGASAGASDGIIAAEIAVAFGIPNGTVICFAVDYDAPSGDYKAINEYLRAAKWNVGNYKIGVYAPSSVLRQLGNLCDFTWRTYAWQTGGAVEADAYQTHYQDLALAKSVQAKVGFAVDLDEAKSIELMWKPNTEEQDALKWAQSFNITDNAAFALALRRYHNTFHAQEDDWGIGTK